MAAFYRIFFTTVDPLIAALGTYIAFATPQVLLESQVAGVTLDPVYAPFFQQLGGYLLDVAFLSTVLLRATSERKVWKILQASILLVDVTLLISIYGSLSFQDRLSPTGWRWEDWVSVAITGGVAALRSSFLLELGLGTTVRAVKRQ